MRDVGTIGWNSAAGKNKLPAAIFMIHIIANRIPELRRILPFIN